ncbi:cytochrome P450 6B4-like [Schistocerca piceifrons]|uniref:cytochrome P450 6B4-like n=1 Tax=Schistocerca piceifrons TaxID=274613 RepID=UPI001F5E5B5D|nr:cytochrome P450 6B4-like [Schistocerca piceifrons]
MWWVTAAGWLLPLFGNVRPVLTFREAAADGYRRLYEAFPRARYIGIYQARHPTLLVRDPVLARRLLGPDFVSFSSRGVPWDARGDPLAAHLLTMDGPAWAALRRKLSGAGSADLEARELAAHYATDVIGRVAFALDFGSLRGRGAADADVDSSQRFGVMARRVIRPTPSAVLRRFARLLLPEWFYRRLKVRSVPQDVADFFCEVVRHSMDEREQSGVARKDFLQTLLDLRSEGRREGDNSLGGIELTEAVVAAQAVAFFAAGLETTASAVCLCLLELAHAPDIQQQAFLELEKAGVQDPPAYEELQGLPFLDAIVAETLRKYPPSPNLVRVATQPYRLPHWSEEGEEGGAREVSVGAGTRLVVPVFAIQRDACHFPDPEDFRPQRFLVASSRGNPAYMPFGDGPRVCIGQRLGMLQLKLAIASVVRHFELSPVPGRTVFPPRLEPRAQVVAPRDGAWVRFTPRQTQS